MKAGLRSRFAWIAEAVTTFPGRLDQKNIGLMVSQFLLRILPVEVLERCFISEEESGFLGRWHLKRKK
jgi:hypothetical protein